MTYRVTLGDGNASAANPANGVAYETAGMIHIYSEYVSGTTWKKVTATSRLMPRSSKIMTAERGRERVEKRKERKER